MFSRDSLHLWILAAGLAGVVGAFLTVRAATLPPTWGQHGHWRGAALTEAAAKPRKVTTRADCLACHQSPKQAFGKKHAKVLCTECHGQGRVGISNGYGPATPGLCGCGFVSVGETVKSGLGFTDHAKSLARTDF